MTYQELARKNGWKTTDFGHYITRPITDWDKREFFHQNIRSYDGQHFCLPNNPEGWQTACKIDGGEAWLVNVV